MLVRRLQIQNFGKISDEELTLSPGLNVIYGENESGKTTIHTFIRCMLYGLQRSRGRGARGDDFTKYEPWENPGEYGGILWISKEDHDYRLTRSFARERSMEELFCETTGEILDIDEGDLEELLGGISETVYENTVSVAQLKSVTGKELIQELQNYMISYQGTGDASMDLNRAMQMLKMTRKGYMTAEEKRKKALEAERNKLESSFNYTYREIEELNQKQKTMGEKHAEGKTAAEAERKQYEKRILSLKQTIKMLRYAALGTAGFALLLAVLLPVVLPSFSWLWILAVLAGGISAGGIFLFSGSYGEEISRVQKSLVMLKKREDKLEWNAESISERMIEKRTVLDNLRQEIQAFDEASLEPSQAQKETEAINLAIEIMEHLTGDFRVGIGDRLRQRMSEILSEITDGKYEEVLISPDFQIRINTENRIVSLESLSRGTLEQIYFALRMAAGELLCGDEVFPVILDDVFGMYDEDRLAAALHWLYKEPRQVIISTCSKREAEILKREGIPFKEILLG
ncbi:MAG: AAA family ATPase [Clostridiales bacterium]|nr:AAA family ATPase [Candidatus Blautia equi]